MEDYDNTSPAQAIPSFVSSEHCNFMVQLE